ncbi:MULTISPECIES: BREX-1 system phosphatase PglZ type A [unclassified Novosphingobium]|uniref:BREX-1 system phosphatase PglZ type A n=1 Tax=unclassified Novosphingobium TaxID=2644732 RepID=UPI00135BC168|nr:MULTISPECIES: BREX-1 system phosphatase PglZ type A [unclassified Novosphingobium]
MDLTHIHTHLKRLFSSGGYDHAGNRIVWWQDREGEFAEELDKLDLENCHQDGVALVRLGEESTLALKVRMLLEEPKARFLIYERGALPDPAHDMLLDIRKWAVPFAADKSTLILRELGLIDELSLKSHIADRARFFASRERMEKLVRFIAPGDGAYQIDLKIMAVLARAPQPQLSQILRILLAELDPQNLTADSKTLAEFQRFGVEQAFWDFVAKEFRYADEAPSPRNLLLRLFATDFARHVTGKVPVSLTHLVLPNGGGSNAIVFMDGWRDSSSHQRSYDALSAVVAEDLRIKNQLTGFALADLEMVHSFLDVEKRLASLLVREVLDASETVNAARIADIARSRQNAYWANAEKPSTEDAPRAALHSVYDAINHAAAFLALKGEVGAQMRSNTASETWKLYTERLYRFDQLYRLFGEAADVSEAQNWDVLKDLRSHIEDVYGNWYLAELGNLWTGQVEPELLPAWQLPDIINQYDFYRREVQPVLDADPSRRMVVIISDAFRYEAAQELFAAMRGTDRYQATMDSMLGVLPSYTALGMASLLPHEQLAYAPDGSVQVDGKSSSGLEARKKLLEAVGGIAIKASDLMEMKKEDGKAFFKPYRVVYVYHDQIDQTADKGNEEKTFVAVRTTIDEISALVRRAFTFNCNRAVVTADHGFLFQSAPPSDAHKNAIKTRPEGAVIAKKRYLIGTSLGDNDGAISGAIAATAKANTDMGFWVPKGINRFHFVGGSRFVHGGAMPQEICIPLLRVNYARGEGKGREKTRVTKVGLAALFHSTRITTSRHRFTITQTEAASDRVQPVTARIALYDGDQQISNAEVIAFDSTAKDMNLWKKEVWLTLANQSFDPHKKYQLIVRDTEDQLDLFPPHPVTISLAFENDF